MKIDNISLTIFAWDNIPATIYHQGALAVSGSNLGLLRIHTDTGLEGHAFLGSASNPASMDGPQLIRTLKPMLMGQNPLERERIHAGMRLVNRNVSYRTIGAVDTALWDLAGKVAGLPVHALMGTFRTSIPAYASSQVLPDVGAYVDQAQTFKAAGWQAYKIHPPRDPDHDIRVCQAVRKAVGDDYRLMLIPLGRTTTPTRYGSAERSRKWDITGLKTRCPTRISTAMSNCARSWISRSWQPSIPPAASIPTRSG